MNKRKKISIKSILSIGLLSFVIPTSYFTNNNFHKSNKEQITNSYINESKEINNINPKVYYGDTYKSVYFNNLTEPVISPNPNLPGFLGYVQPAIGNDTTFFPETIVWTSPNLFASWSANLNDHPSITLINDTLGTAIKPILLSAIHSDNLNQETVFQNQIFAIIGNQNDLNSRNYWLIRYDVAKGFPIVDNSVPALLNMPGSPIPTNMMQGALSITHDFKNNRYIVYYPGVLRDIKNEMYTFSISVDNQLRTWDNEREFAGKSTWTSNNNASNLYLNDNNFLMGIAPLTTPFGNNIIFLVHTGSSSFNSHFRIFELNYNLSLINGWDFNIQRIARSRGGGPYTNNIKVPRNKIDVRLISSKISVVHIGNVYAFSYTLVTENPNDNTQFMYTQLNWKRTVSTKYFHHNFNGIGGSLSRLYVAPKSDIAYIWNNPKKPFEVILINKVNTNINAINIIKITSKFVPANSGDLYDSYNIGEYYNTSNTLNISNAAAFEYPLTPNNFLISLNDNTTINSAIIDGTNVDFNIITGQGGYSIVNPQLSASELGWLDGQVNAKTPSKITNDIIENIGIGTPDDKTKFIRFPLNPKVQGSINIKPTIVNVLRDDTNGTIEGVINLEMTQTEGSTSIVFNGNVSFKVEGLEIVPIPGKTRIELNSNLSETLASSLNLDNISNFFSILNLPPGADRRWDISEQDNQTGSAKISFTTNKYYDGDNIDPVEMEETFFYDAINFRKIWGTNAAVIDSDLTDELKGTMTVWDVNNNNIRNFIQINELTSDENTTPIFVITNQSPLHGTLIANLKIKGGFYDPLNKGLPNTDPDKELNLGGILVDRFLKIDGETSIEAKTGNPSLTTLEITNDALISNYINIINEVPETIVTIVKRENDIHNGNINLTLTLNHAYNDLGYIVRYIDSPDNTLLNYDIVVTGFKQGEINTEETSILNLNNSIVETLLPSAINANNIEELIIIIRKPENANVTYTFSEANNFDGSLRVKAFVKPILSQNGTLNNDGGEVTILLNGFKTIPGITDLKPTEGNRNILAQDVLEGNLTNYYTLSNSSDIEDKETTVEIVPNSLTFNNFLGNISFSYTFDNYFNIFGNLISKSEIRYLTVSGFKKLEGSTQVQLKNGTSSIEKFTAKDFDVSLENYNEHFEIKFPIEGSTKLVGILKVSYNNERGTITFRFDFIDGYINSRGEVENTPGSIEQTISGFQVVKPENNLLYATIGGSVGGFIVLSILVGTLIYIINKKKNEKLLNKSSIPRKAPPTRAPMPPGGNQTARGPMPPGGNQVVNGPIPPQGGNQVVSGPIPPQGGMPPQQINSRPIPPDGNQAVRGPMPIDGSQQASGRPKPPTR